MSNAPRQIGGEVLVAIRPERIRVGKLDADIENRLTGRVEDTVYMGDRLVLRTMVDGGTAILANLEGDGMDAPPSPGDVAEIGWRRQHCLVLDLE